MVESLVADVAVWNLTNRWGVLVCLYRVQCPLPLAIFTHSFSVFVVPSSLGWSWKDANLTTIKDFVQHTTAILLIWQLPYAIRALSLVVDGSCSPIRTTSSQWCFLPLSFCFLAACALFNTLQPRTLVALAALHRLLVQFSVSSPCSCCWEGAHHTYREGEFRSSQVHSNPVQPGSCKSPREASSDTFMRRECNKTSQTRLSNLPPVYMSCHRHHRLDVTARSRQPDLLSSSNKIQSITTRWGTDHLTNGYYDKKTAGGESSYSIDRYLLSVLHSDYQLCTGVGFSRLFLHCQGRPSTGRALDMTNTTIRCF